MESELSRPVVIGVFIMMALVMVQTLFTTILLASTLRRLRSLCQELTRASQRLQRAVRRAHDGLENMIPLLTSISGWATEVTGQTENIQDSVWEIEKKASRSLDSIRERARGAASQMDRAVNRVSTETYRIHRSIMEPAQQFSALIRTGRSIIERWFGRNRNPADVYTTDEDIFI